MIFIQLICRIHGSCYRLIPHCLKSLHNNWIVTRQGKSLREWDIGNDNIFCDGIFLNVLNNQLILYLFSYPKLIWFPIVIFFRIRLIIRIDNCFIQRHICMVDINFRIIFYGLISPLIVSLRRRFVDPLPSVLSFRHRNRLAWELNFYQLSLRQVWNRNSESIFLWLHCRLIFWLLYQTIRIFIQLIGYVSRTCPRTCYNSRNTIYSHLRYIFQKQSFWNLNITNDHISCNRPRRAVTTADLNAVQNGVSDFPFIGRCRFINCQIHGIDINFSIIPYNNGFAFVIFQKVICCHTRLIYRFQSIYLLCRLAVKCNGHICITWQIRRLNGPCVFMIWNHFHTIFQSLLLNRLCTVSHRPAYRILCTLRWKCNFHVFVFQLQPCR